MRIRSFLLAGAVFPFAVAFPALVLSIPAAAGQIVLAQNEESCPEGQECPPPVEQPAPEQPTAEEPPAEAPAAEEPPPAEAPAVEEVPVEEPAVEEPAVEVPAVEPPPVAAPAVEEPVTEEPAVEEVVPEQPAVEEAPAAEEAPAEQPAAQEPAAEQPAAEQPAAEQPAEGTTEEAPAAEGTPEDALQRAQEQQELLEQQQQGEQPAEATSDVPTEGESAEEIPAETTDGEVLENPPVIVDEIPPGETVIEQQLEATGDEQGAEQVQELIIQLEQEQEEADQEAEAAGFRTDDDDDNRGDGRRGRGWWEDEGGDIVEQYGDRIIIDLGGGNIFVEPVHPDREERLLYNADDVEVQNLPGGRTRTIVYRENGSQIVTVRDRRGNLLSRVRVRPDGTEVVLFDYRFDGDDDEDWYLPPPVVYGPGELPPYLVDLPEEEYIYYYSNSSVEEIEQVLLAPPIIQPERAYTVEEVTRNQGIRDIVPRIDLDTITFEFGSATISSSQMDELVTLGQAMEAVIEENPAEVYLIEGHTDAVGSDYDNLILSDQRAEAVAVALTYNFDIPPENLITEGYGEQYLKVNTQAAEQQNRRVTVRRITPLLQAQN